MIRTIACAAATILFSAGGQAQEASPQFEVASIKPSPPYDGRGMTVGSHGGPGTDDPGMYRCENCEVSSFITTAYDLQSYQFLGQPWMNETRFMLSAKIPEGTTKAQFRLMMQSLLAERFKLTFHYEKKETVGYDLLVIKNGPKFKEASAEPSSEDDSQRADFSKKDADGFPVLPPGRTSMMIGTGSGYAQRFGQETMEPLVHMLSIRLGGPVVDTTGLRGKYDFELRWTDDRFAGGDSLGLPITKAIQDQLGLRVQKKKLMVDIFVVDHLEKVPTEN
jgi:uncharacterized protein (TIGR03435 family)